MILNRFFFAACLLVPSIANGQIQAAKTSSLPDVIDSVKMSIVRIEAKFTYQLHAKPTTMLPNPLSVSREGSSFGTGFIVDRSGRVGTANHVVDASTIELTSSTQLTGPDMIFVPGSLRVTGIIVSVFANNYNSDHGSLYNVREQYAASIFGQDRVWDTAILTPERNILTARSGMILTTTTGESLGPKARELPSFQLSAPREGDDVSVSGFPSVIGQEAGIPGITTNGGKIANAMFDSGTLRFVYLTDMHVNHGDSGGPVLRMELER